MPYQKLIQEELNRGGGSFRDVVSKLQSLSGKHILYFSHDDPDGITCALLMTKIFRKLKISFDLYLPETYELERFRVENAIKNSRKKYDALIVTDKGTQDRLDTYTDLIKDIIIIDHHFIQGMPKKCLLFHPQVYCSCSHLVHMLVTALDFRDDYDDFINLVGLKGDWVIDPRRNFAAEFVEPFVKEAKRKFPGLFKIVRGNTWFDIAQDGRTSVLSTITEVVHALTGGGFQYYYNDRHPSLAKINPPLFTMQQMKKMRKNVDQLRKQVTVDDFFKLFPDSTRARRIWNFYLEDWARSNRLMDSSVPVGTFDETTIFLFVGNEVRLIPMLGSVKLSELSKKNGLEHAILIMLNREPAGSIHYSLRATSDRIHVGKICNLLADRLVRKFGHPDEITGGGHPVAGECKIRITDVPVVAALKELSDILSAMHRLTSKSELSSREIKEAERCGLDKFTSRLVIQSRKKGTAAPKRRAKPR